MHTVSDSLPYCSFVQFPIPTNYYIFIYLHPTLNVIIVVVVVVVPTPVSMQPDSNRKVALKNHPD